MKTGSTHPLKDIWVASRLRSSGSVRKLTLIDLMEYNVNHIIPSCCHLPVSCKSLVDRCGSLEICKPQILFYFIIITIRIHTAKNPLPIPKHQKCLFSAISSSMFLLPMKSVTLFFHDCCGLPLLL